MFTLDERIEMAKESVKNLQNVTVVGFDNLTVELARTYNAKVLIRGLRAVSDFEYEVTAWLLKQLARRHNRDGLPYAKTATRLYKLFHREKSSQI